MKRTCATCGKPTEATYNLCEPCLDTRTIAERAAQGLPPMFEDPDSYRRLAKILVAHRREQEARAHGGES